MNARQFCQVSCSAILGLLGACAVTGPTSPNNKYLVSVKNAQFYKYGPAQAFGPDFNLPQGQKVTMLDRQFGYSRVQLADGVTTGYLATEELTPAPPDPVTPKPKAVAKSKPSGFGGLFSSGKPKHSNVEPVPSDPLFDINDVPLPMPPETPKSGSSSAPKQDSSLPKP